MKLWNRHSSWDEAEKLWDKRAESAAQAKPLKRLHVLPQMPGIAPADHRFLKLKGFRFILFRKGGLKIFKHILKRPFYYGFFYLKSLIKKSPFVREGDFFFYGVKSLAQFEELLQGDFLLAVGFSYCQKPFECPDGRFTDKCRHEEGNPVCQQCDIGKILHALPTERVVPLIIPTVHYIGEKLFEIKEKYPKKKILFLITACELTLTMFADFGQMLNVKGVGVRLDGRICNTMKAFVLSEEGIKPGLTLVTEATQKKLLALIRKMRENN